MRLAGSRGADEKRCFFGEAFDDACDEEVADERLQVGLRGRVADDKGSLSHRIEGRTDPLDRIGSTRCGDEQFVGLSLIRAAEHGAATKPRSRSRCAASTRSDIAAE